MSWLIRLLTSLRANKLDHQLDAELQFHIDMRTQEFTAEGLTPEEARHRARLLFGNQLLQKERTRDMDTVRWLETLWQDLRYAARILLKSPGFTITAILALALGIGVNTTLFTAYDSVALKLLPLADAQNVARIKRWFASGNRGDDQYAFSYPEYVFYREHGTPFSGLVAASWPTPVFAAPPETDPRRPSGFRQAERASVQFVSANYFSVLQVAALAGRMLYADDNRDPVVVISYSFWHRKFPDGVEPLGKIIKLNDVAFTIVGVAAQEFIGTGLQPRTPDFWVLLTRQPQLMPGQDWTSLNTARRLQILGRMQNGIRPKQAASEMTVHAQQFALTHPERDKTLAITLQPATYFAEADDPRFQAFIAGLLLLVGLVLLVACANLANMLLARSVVRTKEISVRLALGASRGRLIRQLLTESVLLSLMGGVTGLLFSLWASKLLFLAIAPLLQLAYWSDTPLAMVSSPDARVLAYTLLLSLVSAALFGLSPALRSSKRDLTTALKEEGASRLTRSRLRSLLVGGQAAVSMLLLIISGLFLRGTLRSQTADPGFDTKDTYIVACNFGTDEAKARALHRQILDRLAELPQVRGVTLTERPPYMGTWTATVTPTGNSGSGNVEARSLANHVAPSYFTTLGIPIVRGRAFTRQEGETGANVAIISDSGARLIWPGQDPIGQQLKIDSGSEFEIVSRSEFEIVGVAKDVRTANLTRIDPSFLYLPASAARFDATLVRIQGNRNDALAAIRRAIEAVDSKLLPSLWMMSLDENPVRIQRLMIQTTTTFAAALACLALALAAVGIYGVMSYLVTQRTSEIGIRMALGADAGGVLKSVVLAGLKPVFVGAVLGLAGAAVFSAALHATLVFPGSMDFLYGVNMLDPITFVGLSLFVACAAAVASAIPARRATKVDPMVALRYE